MATERVEQEQPTTVHVFYELLDNLRDIPEFAPFIQKYSAEFSRTGGLKSITTTDVPLNGRKYGVSITENVEFQLSAPGLKSAVICKSSSKADKVKEFADMGAELEFVGNPILPDQNTYLFLNIVSAGPYEKTASAMLVFPDKKPPLTGPDALNARFKEFPEIFPQK